ncbi:hypothetical protein B0H67DRAFT_644479 [Lasiosphaeris hirsuta]|uniref:Uncharacterized protein n=1 Tax=Lasiosphaeris hirsuta TaxID=260670 RepID=A0AA40DT76_9PEZI|nr:hypothetical protein B0H67DRAFT_644479 [Lasiosphaeris hirsuta]
MSLWKSYQNLSPKSKLAVGATLLFWGATGPYLSDKLGEAFGYNPTEADKAALPKIHIVPRDDSKR